MILAIALFAVLVISAVAVAPEAYASGGLTSLVAHGAQDVYLTNNPLKNISYKQSTPVISDINSYSTVKQEHLALLAKIFMQRIQLISTNFRIGS